jgi:hypothetical protein
MNFISHFYIDRDVQNSLFIVGSITPDLMSIYNSSLRIKKSHLNRFQSNLHPDVPQSFVDGLARHFFVDRVFHSSVHFQAETQRISRELAQRFPQYDIQRKFFIGHILLELLLDKILIDSNPDLLEDFYAHFSQAEEYPLIQNATAEISGHDLPKYTSFLKKFHDHKYLRQYQKYEHISFVLNHILRRVKITKIEYLDDPDFIEYMKDYEAGLKERYQVFFQEIRDAEGAK